MAGNIELRHHTDAAIARVGYDLPDLGLRVEQAVRPFLVQLGKPLALHAEALVFGEVPVEDVELHGGHGVQIALHYIERHEVARRIEHQAAPGKAGLILNVDGGNLVAVRAEGHELREGSQAVEYAGARGRFERGAIRGHIQRVRFVLAERRVIAARRSAFHSEFWRCILQAEHRNSGLPREADHKAAEAQLAFLAYHDPLTGLPNRMLFREHLDVALRRAASMSRLLAIAPPSTCLAHGRKWHSTVRF